MPVKLVFDEVFVYQNVRFQRQVDENNYTTSWTITGHTTDQEASILLWTLDGTDGPISHEVRRTLDEIWNIWNHKNDRDVPDPRD